MRSTDLASSRRADIYLPAIAGIALVTLLSALTNALDIQKYDWDFRYYIAMARHGFGAEPLASPFAYRFGTPAIAGLVADWLSGGIETGFRVVAYVGAVLQLVAVYLLALRFSGSRKGAWVAMLITAFSAMNVKFLLFDPFRPDHLAYAWVIGCFYLAATGRHWWLLAATAVGLQFREFVVVPLVALALSSLYAYSDDPRTAVRAIGATALCFAVAVVLPRVLIPVEASYEMVQPSTAGLRSLFRVPLNPKRDLNLVFVVLAYLLPCLMLVTPARLQAALSTLGPRTARLSAAYTVLVLLLTLYGGTDLARFTTYLLVPQALLIALLARDSGWAEIGVMIVATLVFNRIWMQIPIWDLEKYLDFYGGYSSRVNGVTALRFLEIGAFLVLAALARAATQRTVRGRYAST